MNQQTDENVRGVALRSNSRKLKENGAAAVEFALVLMLLVPLLGGLIDASINFQLKRKLVDGIRSSARAGAQSCFGGITCLAGNPTDADNQALEAVRGVLGSTSATVTKIILYKALSGDDQVPPACLAAPVGIAGLCQVIDAPFQSDTPYSGSTLWPSGSRRRTDPGADYLGVYAQIDHNNLIGFFGQTTKIAAHASFRLETPPTPNEALPVLPLFPQTGFPWEFYSDVPPPTPPKTPPATPVIDLAVEKAPEITPAPDTPVVATPLAGNGAG
jgi:TadE-like protein